jgi:inhibitor of KinA
VIHIFPLGDAAATIELGNAIDEALNKKVLAMQAWLLAHRIEGVKDVVTGYSSLSILYDPALLKQKFKPVSTVFELVRYILEEAYHHADVPTHDDAPLIRIPVCYDNSFGTDLEAIATKKQLATEDIIRLHTSVTYRVYMIGFLPGFPYLAQVDEQLVLPRKASPVPVAPGSVAIAGRQTGIYPYHSPGGWHIIGRTNTRLFDPEQGLSTLKAGDTVQFYAIGKDEFEGFSDIA